MKFKGTSVTALHQSKISWGRWLRKVGEDSPRARFAIRFAEEAERLMPPAQPRLAVVADSAMMAASREELHGQWLSKAELRDAILALAKSWRYGASLRVWAAERRYIRESDR